MEENPNRTEAIRLLGISEKLLQTRNLNGARDFAVLSQQSDPSLEGSDQIVSIIDVLIAADKRINNHPDWYSILQVDRRSDDDLIKRQYRRLALLLHPDKNRFAFADQAFKLVADAWSILSNNSKKSNYDRELGLFTRIYLSGNHTTDQSVKLQVRKGEQKEQSGMSTFWTACPYCYRLYEYPKVYEGCCMRCPNCQRSFDAVRIPSLPPLVPGKEAYYCCWAFFPLGFLSWNPGESRKAPVPAEFPNSMPLMFASGLAQAGRNGRAAGGAAAAAAAASVTTVPTAMVTPTPTAKMTAETRNIVLGMPTGSATKKRGRPRKNPVKV